MQCFCNYQRLISGRSFLPVLCEVHLFRFLPRPPPPFFGRLYLICLLSPMRGVPLLCCLPHASCNPSRCHGLSAFSLDLCFFLLPRAIDPPCDLLIKRNA